jgi:arylformamidase
MIMPQWIDISLPVTAGMARWPGDPEIRVERLASIGPDSFCNLTAISMCAHTGTHMDAPLHFIDGGAAMESMPLDAVIGPARVIEISGPEKVARHELERHALRRGERILLKASNSTRLWKTGRFIEDFVYIAQDAADYMAAAGIRTVGIDAYSVGGFRHDLLETHVSLLAAGIWIVEGLMLEHVTPGEYEFICLPMKLIGADGAPARAVLRRM